MDNRNPTENLTRPVDVMPGPDQLPLLLQRKGPVPCPAWLVRARSIGIRQPWRRIARWRAAQPFLHNAFAEAVFFQAHEPGWPLGSTSVRLASLHAAGNPIRSSESPRHL